MMLQKIKYGFYFLLLITFTSQYAWSQGFLEMPDTTEVPEFERESMLLDLDVPPVRERDPDPEAGPRLNVKEFRLQGLVEFPSLGITREELIKRVEAIRFDLMSEGELTDSGYTLDELGEISDLMAQIEKDSAEEHVGPLEVQKLVFLIREQRRRRGVTLGMIETVADTITRYYRERGFILAKAYIPQQKVRDGVVTLTLLLGELGEVAVENKKRVSDKLVERVFKRDMNKPVTSWNVEESLYLVNDIPGLSAQGFFSPGSQVGDTKLSVNVSEERWYSANFRLDNHGSESTSENRAYADIFIHNPLGWGDELYIGALSTFSPSGGTFGSVRYNSFVMNPRIRASVGVSTNDFVSRDQSNTQAVVFTGESTVADASIRYIFKRSRVKNISVELEYADIATDLNFGESTEPEEQGADNVSLAFNFDILNEKRRQLYIGDITITSSSTFSGFERESDSSAYLSYDLSMLSFVKIPFTKTDTRLLIKSAGQYAGDVTSNLNQISLTGPTRARAFGSNGYQADDGIYLGIDWIFNFPKFGGAKLFGEELHRIFQPYIYTDLAYGIQNQLESDNDDTTGEFANVGMGLKFAHSKLNGSINFSSPVRDVVTNGDTLQEDLTPTSTVYFDLQYSF